MQRALSVILTSCVSALAGCTPPEVTAVRSPNGTLVAKLIDDRGGGAATSAYQRVTIEEANQPFGPKVSVFYGEDVSGRAGDDLNVFWIGEERLGLGYCDGTIDKVLSTAQIGSRRIVVKLIQERPGVWPAINLRDRRSGPPRCA